MKPYEHIRRVLILTFPCVYLLNYFLDSPTLAVINTLLLITIVLQSITTLPKATLAVTLGLFIIGGVILTFSGAAFLEAISAVYKNAGLVTLFIAVPLLRLPLFYEDYQKELLNVAQKHMTNVMSFCLLTSVIIHLLGVIISIGAVPLVYSLFQKNAELYKGHNLFLRSMLQGYMTSGYWSPAWASIAVVTTGLAIPWLKLIPIGILFAALNIAVGLLLIYRKTRQDPERYVSLSPQPGVTVNWQHVFTLGALIGGFILAIVFVDLLTSWELLVIIPLVAAFFPLTSGLLQHKMPQFKQGMKNYYSSVVKVKNEVILFTAAGFLGKSLEISGVSEIIPHLLPSWLVNYPLAGIFFIMLMMILISLTGIHPVVTGTALVGAIDPFSLGLVPFIFGLTIITGWAIAILVSPFSGINLIMGGLEKTQSWNISLGISGSYGLIMLVLMSFVLTGMQMFL